MSQRDSELNIPSQHRKPPLWLLGIWVTFFIYLLVYLNRYAWPDLLKWLAR